jgi:hypothetical protein
LAQASDFLITIGGRVSYFSKIIFAALVACQIGSATPQLTNCVLTTEGSIDCNISGKSSDMAISSKPNGGFYLTFPGYYLKDPHTATVTLTTVANNYPAEFYVNFGTPEKSNTGIGQLMLTKSISADFDGKVKLVNSWLLVGWTNY